MKLYRKVKLTLRGSRCSLQTRTPPEGGVYCAVFPKNQADFSLTATAVAQMRFRATAPGLSLLASTSSL